MKRETKEQLKTYSKKGAQLTGKIVVNALKISGLIVVSVSKFMLYIAKDIAKSEQARSDRKRAARREALHYRKMGHELQRGMNDANDMSHESEIELARNTVNTMFSPKGNLAKSQDYLFGKPKKGDFDLVGTSPFSLKNQKRKKDDWSLI